MPHSQRPDDFAERLRRIEARRQPQPQPDTPDQPITPPCKAKHPLRNGLIWLCAMGALGAGGFALARSDGQTSLASMTGNLSQIFTGAFLAAGQAARDQTPSGAGERGANPPTPELATTHDRRITLAEIVTDPALPHDRTRLGQVQFFDSNQDCSLRRPQAGEKIVNIHLENASQPLPMRVINAADLTAQLERNIAEVTEQGRTYNWDAQVSGQMRAVDVLLTDQDGPLYLVLQNHGDGIIWNLMPAPGVTLAHVAIVTTATSGLAGLPTGTGYEAILQSSTVEGPMPPCDATPWRAPEPDWAMVRRSGNDRYAAELATFTQGHATYAAWYQETLGVAAGLNLISAQTAAHVLVGPVPAAPFPYRALAGQDIHLMRSDHVLMGETIDLAVQSDLLHAAALREMLGGDISLLTAQGTD
jgi:hypothetical protein